MKRSTLALVGLGVLAVGAVGGFYVGYLFTRSEAAMAEFAEVAYYGTYLETQRANGNDAGYEEALRGYLDILERRKGKPSVFSSAETVIASDAALTHVRLALLAERRSANAAARGHMAAAMALCPTMKWNTCSEEQLRSMVQYLDRKTRFGMPSRTEPDAQPAVAADAPPAARR